MEYFGPVVKIINPKSIGKGVYGAAYHATIQQTPNHKEEPAVVKIFHSHMHPVAVTSQEHLVKPTPAAYLNTLRAFQEIAPKHGIKPAWQQFAFLKHEHSQGILTGQGHTLVLVSQPFMEGEKSAEKPLTKLTNEESKQLIKFAIEMAETGLAVHFDTLRKVNGQITLRDPDTPAWLMTRAQTTPGMFSLGVATFILYAIKKQKFGMLNRRRLIQADLALAMEKIDDSKIDSKVKEEIIKCLKIRS